MWLYVVPWGIRRTLCWLKERYGNPPVYITENGFSDSTGTLDDHDRIDYLRRYINEVLKGNVFMASLLIFFSLSIKQYKGVAYWQRDIHPP